MVRSNVEYRVSSDLGDIYGNANPEVIIHLLLQKVSLLLVVDRRH